MTILSPKPLVLTFAFLGSVNLLNSAEIWVDGTATSHGDGTAAAPFTTINAAVAVAAEGDTVTIKAGTYHESVALKSGRKESPFTLQSAAGERVILSTFRKINDWQDEGNGVYSTTVDWKVRDLFVGYKQQPLAIWPNKDEPWRNIATINQESGEITDVTPLDSSINPVATSPANCFAYIYVKRGNYHDKFPLQSLNSAENKLSLGKKKRWNTLSTDNSYRLCNHASLIDQAGEWSYESLENERTKITFMPHDPADLKRTQARGSNHAAIHTKPNTQYARISGIETAGGISGGINLRDATDIAVENCISYGAQYAGIGIRTTKNITIKHCIVFGNHTGIGVSDSQNIIIEENEVAANRMDGIIVAGDISGNKDKKEFATENVIVRRNYVHHHLDLGHPDNFQMYRGTKEVEFVDNVGLWAGQTLMMEASIDGTLEGNVFFGSGAIAVIFGHKNSNNWKIRGNTIGLGGMGLMNFSGHDYQVNDNIFYQGNIYFVDSYQGDYNLLVGDTLTGGYLYTTKPKWHAHQSVASFFEQTGQDEHSAYGDPHFKNAPLRQAVVKEMHPQGTAARLFLQQRKQTTEGFAVGDHIEVNGDGIVRSVTAVDSESITIDPALPRPPFRVALVWNWGTKTDFQLDLTPATDSLARKMGKGESQVGSKMDIPAFQRGDLNGNGKRDLPDLADELIKEAWPTINNPVTPSVGI